jgi:hypothetical protein
MGFADEALGAMDDILARLPPDDAKRTAMASMIDEARRVVAKLPIQNVRVALEHNVQTSDGLGMIFHITGTARGMQGKPCQATVYIYDTGGSPYEHRWEALMTGNTEYRTASGKLASSKSFTPTSDPFELDLAVPLPYDLLYSGAYRYRYVMRIFDTRGGTIASRVDGDFHVDNPPR